MKSSIEIKKAGSSTLNFYLMFWIIREPHMLQAINEWLSPIFSIYLLSTDCIHIFLKFFIRGYNNPSTVHKIFMVFFALRAKLAARFASVSAMSLAFLGTCCNLTVARLFSNYKAYMWYEMRRSFLTSYSLGSYLMANSE